MSNFPDRAVERTIHAVFEESALANERALSIVRSFFCLAIGVRFALTAVAHPMQEGAARAWVTYPALAAAILFSAAVYLRWWRTRIPLLLHLSVAMDALICFAALLPNVVWPGPGYAGVANMADATALMIILLAAGLRYSTTAALLGSLLNGCSYGVLVLIERWVRGDEVPLAGEMYLVFAIYLSATSVVAVIIATASRRLALRAATAAVKADWAGRSLRELLHEHHDVRALVSAARIHADLLARDLDGASPRVERAAPLAEDLRADLEALHALVDDIKVHAYADLLAMEGAQPVEVADVFEEVTSLFGDRYPSVTVRSRCEGKPRALIAGGRPGFRRALFNLVVNACEGTGARGARLVELCAAAGGRGVRIEILDDGPGFPNLSTEPGTGLLPSTKPGGTGLGLDVAFAVTHASGGAMTLGNREGGGGQVVIELRATESDPARNLAVSAGDRVG